MNYKEFRNSAHRHLLSCQVMCNALHDIKSTDEKKAVIFDIYYLSGYVIETLLSYAIFCMSPREVKMNSVENHPDFDKGFKTHNFQAKIDFAQRHGCDLNGILFISQTHTNPNLMRLYREWCVELRYQQSCTKLKKHEISEKIISEYIYSLKEVEQHFNSKFI